jgi:hypothetical protein
MRKPTYPMIIVALASMLVVPPLSAFAQREPGPQAASDKATAGPPPPPPPKELRHAFYYRPGDLKGVPYDTIEECTKARQQAGDVGVCVIK